MASWLPWVRLTHRRLRAIPWSPEWRDIVHTRVPLVARLDNAGRATLESLVQVFLHDKTFEGLGGLEITDEIRLTIAAQACLLLVGLEVDDPYPGLDAIRVYPSTIRVPRKERNGLIVTESAAPHLGLSSARGYVVLSWDATRSGADDPADGKNVVLHEFAHQLDTEDGASDGAPILADANLYRPWARILGAAYTQLIEDVNAVRPTVLDGYGTTNPAEFFAVATEAFFERPRALKDRHRDLYDVLARYFRQDPAG